MGLSQFWQQRSATLFTATLWIATTKGKQPDPSERAQGPRPTQANTAKLPQDPSLTPLPAAGHLPFSEDGRSHVSRKGPLVPLPTCLGPSPLPQWLPRASPLLLRPWVPTHGPTLSSTGELATPLHSLLDGQQTPLVSNPTPQAHHIPHGHDEGLNTGVPCHTPGIRVFTISPSASAKSPSTFPPAPGSPVRARWDLACSSPPSNSTPPHLETRNAH